MAGAKVKKILAIPVYAALVVVLVPIVLLLVIGSLIEITADRNGRGYR